MNNLNVAKLDAACFPRSTAIATQRGLWYLCLGVLLTAFLLLGGCGGGGGGGDKQGQLRTLNVSPDYDSLDMYVSDGTDGADNLKFSAVAYGTVSAFTTVKAATYAIKFKRSGLTTTLLTLASAAIGKDTHSLYVAYGSTGRFGAIKVGEDQADPDTNRSNVQVVNTSEAGSLDVYLTDESVALSDATAQAAALASGALSGLATIDSGTYRLRVTGSGDKTDLRLDVSNLVFSSKSSSTIVLTATQGGVLVNALMLPKQGSVTSLPNTKARIRGAVGISNGTSLTASVGGVTLLSGAATGVIGSKYSQVAAGAAAVVLNVDGTLINIPSQTLTAGADYTLLFWNDTSGTHATLINDANRLPTTTGKVKLRMMNGMSGLAVPATLAVDFAPIAEGVALGQAAAFTEIDAGTDYQLDVTNTSTSASLLTRDAVTLQDAGIYTLFMWGGGATPVSGTLRKDR